MNELLSILEESVYILRLSSSSQMTGLVLRKKIVFGDVKEGGVLGQFQLQISQYTFHFLSSALKARITLSDFLSG